MKHTSHKHPYICEHGDDNIFGSHHDYVNALYNHDLPNNEIIGGMFRLARRPFWDRVMRGIFDE
jgi:hypothetical protein